MFKISFAIVIIAVILILPLRFAITTGGFLQEGIIDGIQSCKVDSDCTWAPTGCCNCEVGGGEMLINKNKEFLYKLLVKEVCIGEQSCVGENSCNEAEVFCDRTCKFGKRTYTRPLLAQ